MVLPSARFCSVLRRAMPSAGWCRPSSTARRLQDECLCRMRGETTPHPRDPGRSQT
jgi:hypothetical protein